MSKDTQLTEKTTLSAKRLLQLWEICISNTYFLFNENLYQQISGLAMGASSSVFAAEIFMQNLEKVVLATFLYPPEIWKRYVDDIFTKLKKHLVQMLEDHLNKQHKAIKVTTEVMKDKKLSYLDTLASVREKKPREKKPKLVSDEVEESYG